MTFKNKIAFITTSHASIPLGKGTSQQSGVWLSEVTTPYYALLDEGLNIDLYSIQGGVIPIDPHSVGPRHENEDSVERYLKDEHLQNQLENSPAISSLNVDDYDAVFLPGGHGTMWDFPNSVQLAEVVKQTLEGRKILAAVCHGSVGLINAQTDKGFPLIAGYKLTGFTNAEEQETGLYSNVPFLLESRLNTLGATFVNGVSFKPNVVRDRNLITGQNPASSDLVAKQILQLLRETYDTNRKLA